jgi:hypothetical protein
MTTPVFVRRRAAAGEHPVEMRFVDMLLIIIATLMVVTIVLSVVSAFNGNGRVDVAPEVATRSAPAAIVRQAYQLTLAVHGGDGDYTWEKVAGVLPRGLTLDRRSGLIEGKPQRVSTHGISLQVRDGSGRVSAVRELTIRVRPSGAGDAEQAAPRIAAAVTLLDDAVAGRLYEHSFDAAAGTPPYEWDSTELPAGLELAPDGTLVGRPEAGGTSTFTVTMMEAGGAEASQEVRLVVAEESDSLFGRSSIGSRRSSPGWRMGFWR